MAARGGLCLAVLAAFLPPSAALAESDADVLKGLHAKVMKAHRESNVELILENDAQEYVVASRGEISRPTPADRRARLGPYLRRTVFQEYRDLVEPIVSVSSDGTLGWVVVQIQARGIQTSDAGAKEPIEFVSAWIELYRKRDGVWYRVGSVSNFKE